MHWSRFHSTPLMSPHSSFRISSYFSRSHISITQIACTSQARPNAKPKQSFDVVVVGGGAAGVTAAYFAAQNSPNAKVTVLERTREAGKKVLMSGGERCNVVPGYVSIDKDYYTDSSRSALRAIFSSWTLEECLAWLNEDIGLRLSLEETSNKYFPTSNSSREVRDRLVSACEGCGVEFQYNAGVVGLNLSDGEWHCNLESGELVKGKKIVFATGGKSFPLVGTDGMGHGILESMGHNMNETYPALTPLTGSHPGGERLPGVSLYDVSIQTRVSKGKGGVRSSNRSGFLFTHKGYSGPSILDMSHIAVKKLEKGETRPKMVVNWTGKLEDFWESVLKESRKVTVANCIHRHGIPQRLSTALCEAAGVPFDKRTAELRKAELKSLLDVLVRYELPYDGHQGYRKAEVTGGGVPLSEINCSSMESRVLPGVHLCGEIMDVFGRIGGFNFYWAWVSGRLAGLGCTGGKQ